MTAIKSESISVIDFSTETKSGTTVPLKIMMKEIMIFSDSRKS